VDDIGRRTVLLPKLGQLAVDVLIFGSPLLAVLRRKNVILGVVDDFGLRACQGIAESVFHGNRYGIPGDGVAS